MCCINILVSSLSPRSSLVQSNLMTSSYGVSIYDKLAMSSSRRRLCEWGANHLDILPVVSLSNERVRIASTKSINPAEVHGVEPTCEFTSKVSTYSATLRMRAIAAAGFVEGSSSPANRNCRSPGRHKLHGRSNCTRGTVHY
jgi:hypothetical protein